LVMRQSVQAVHKTITITAANVADTEEEMIDYAEKLLALSSGCKAIAKALIKGSKQSIIDEINDLIIHAIELKQWVEKNL